MAVSLESGGAGEKQPPLRVLIVGAGIGGLTTAIALSRQGHDVTIFEQSRFANEIGAAIHLAPNCNGILRRLGIYAEDFGANTFDAVANHAPSGQLLQGIDLKGANTAWQHPYHLVHRVGLHKALQNKVLEQERDGKSVTLKLASRIVEVGCDASIILENGEKYTGDVVIGADGVHSKTRDAVTGGTVKPFDCGKSAFRFLLPTQVLLDDPATKEYAEKENCLRIFLANDRRLVMYPCENSTIMNFVAIHPSNESQSSSKDWNQQGNKDLLLELYKDFAEPVRAMLSKVDVATLRRWPLLDMTPLETWIKGRVALMGDAAHPFQPHQGQGGGVAIEDAASLAVLLHEGVPRDEIPERLKLYEKCRLERAHNIQEYTRLAGRDLDQWGRQQVNFMTFTNYNLGHDEWDNTTQELRRWLWEKDPKIGWRMPLSFGPMPGPRQDRDSYHCASVTASIKFKTSRTLLQNLFPTTAFSFQSPGTVAYASVSCTTLTELDWLGGRGYNHLGFYLHGVKYTQKDGSAVNGTFLAVLFEDLADPIITGRDELGMPKIYSTIDVVNGKDKDMQVTTGWQGTTFGKFEWEGLELSTSSTEVDGIVPDAPLPTASTGPAIQDDGLLTYRYVPAVGDPGKADAQYAVFIPHGTPPGGAEEKVMKATKAHISFTPHDWKALPTLHNVASRLAELPIYDIREAKVVEKRGLVDGLKPVRLN
ncbi:hypothetical protein FQN51_007658 [Onygenales sp. PD_10]|nr:hypothetical protein FQN51_007658 [Onygenales sp. PD_10]